MEMLETTCAATQHHVPEDLHVQAVMLCILCEYRCKAPNMFYENTVLLSKQVVCRCKSCVPYPAPF